jgi:O-antigen ligase
MKKTFLLDFQMNTHFIFFIFFTIAVIKPINIPNINRYMGMGLFVLISIWFLIILIKNYRHVLKNYLWEIIAIILFLVINLISLLTNLHRFETTTQLIFFGFASFAVWLIFPMAWVIFQYSSGQKYRWIGWSVMLFMGLVALWQVFDMSFSKILTQHFVADDIHQYYSFRAITSLTRNPTIYGVIAAIIILVCLKLLLSLKLSTEAKLFFILLALLSLYTGIMSESRNFIFTLGVGLMAMSFKNFLKFPKTTISLVMIAIIGIHFLVINNDRVVEKYGRALPYLAKISQNQALSLQDFVPKFDNRSTTSRIIIWKHGIGLWKENPWMGMGAGSYRLSNNYKSGRINLHNYYLQVLIDSGVIGVFSLIILLVLLLKRAYYAGNLTIFVAILSSLIFDNYLDYSMGWVLCMVWLLTISNESAQKVP